MALSLSVCGYEDMSICTDSQGLNMEAVSRALELDFNEWKLAKEESGEEASQEQS